MSITTPMKGKEAMTNTSTPPEDPASNDMDEAQRAAYERAEHEAQVLDEFFPQCRFGCALSDGPGKACRCERL